MTAALGAAVALLGVVFVVHAGAAKTHRFHAVAATKATTPASHATHGPVRPTKSKAAKAAHRTAPRVLTAARIHASGAGNVTVLSVPSADNDLTPRSVYLYRPAVPAGTVLPVLYLLHGYPGHPAPLMRVVAPALDAAFEQGAAPFAVAIPDGNGNAHSDTEWADSADGRTLVETSVVSRIVPAVERVVDGGTLPPGLRAIGGFSMGGYGAVNIALRNPALFRQVVGVSGYYHTDDESAMFAGRSSLIYANTPDDNVGRIAGKRLLLLEDQYDPESLIAGQAADFYRRVAACECTAQRELHIDPGGHELSFVGAEIPRIVGFLDAGWLY